MVPAFSNTLPSILLQQFVTAMRSSLDGAEDPNDMAVDRCLPGMNKRFDAAQHERRRIDAKAEQRHRELMGKVGKVEEDGMNLRDDIADSFSAAASNMKRHGYKGDGNDGGRKRSRIDDNRSDDNDDDGDLMWLSTVSFQTRKPECVLEIYQEWRGLGRFEGVPIDGGIEAVELKTKKKWRKDFQGADQKHFSRVFQLVGAIDREVKKDRTILDVIKEFEQIFDERKKSLSALVVELQNRGLLPKKVRNSQQSP